MNAGICEHCGAIIPYHRGRALTICYSCRATDHKGDPETCVECAKVNERFETMVNAATEKVE